MEFSRGNPCKMLESILKEGYLLEVEATKVRFFIDHAVNVFTTNELSGFVRNVCDYSVEMYLYLIRQCPDLVHTKIRFGSAIHFAATDFTLSQMSTLLELGAPINSVGGYNVTALDQAVWHHRSDIVLLLLKNGASTMIGTRSWAIDYPVPEHVLIRRVYYLAVVSRMDQLVHDHWRLVIEMLV